MGVLRSQPRRVRRISAAGRLFRLGPREANTTLLPCLRRKREVQPTPETVRSRLRIRTTRTAAKAAPRQVRLTARRSRMRASGRLRRRTRTSTRAGLRPNPRLLANLVSKRGTTDSAPSIRRTPAMRGMGRTARLKDRLRESPVSRRVAATGTSVLLRRLRRAMHRSRNAAMRLRRAKVRTRVGATTGRQARAVRSRSPATRSRLPGLRACRTRHRLRGKLRRSRPRPSPARLRERKRTLPDITKRLARVDGQRLSRRWPFLLQEGVRGRVLSPKRSVLGRLAGVVPARLLLLECGPGEAFSATICGAPTPIQLTARARHTPKERSTPCLR